VVVFDHTNRTMIGLLFNVFHGIKLTASVLELADLRWDYDAVLAVGPIQTPQMGIVRAQSETFDMPDSWTIGFDLLDL
jgi:hypothetical protein